MSVHIKPCAKCRRAKERRPKDRRSRKTCPDCKWIAITPPSLGRRSLGVFRTKDDADAAIQQALVNHRNGIEPLPITLAVADVVERFFKDGTRDHSPTTTHRYRELWDKYAIPIAGLPVAQLRKAHIVALYNGLRGRLAGRTILHVHRLLHRAFAWAVEHDVLRVNPFATVKSPAAEPSEARALTHDEAARFFAAAKGSAFEDFFVLAALTGARRGELVALKWANVDLDGKVMAIREAHASTRATRKERLAGASLFVTKAPKSGKARSVPLDDDAIAAFRRIRARQAEARLRAGAAYTDRGFVFADAIGEPLDANAATAAFRAIANRAELPRVLSLHSLRHTAASWALAHGADITAVQHVLGHSVPSTTLNLYGHVVAGAKERAVRGVADTLRAAVKGA
jgi:integrase